MSRTRRPSLSLEPLEARLVLNSNASFVQGLYQELLHRTASQPEVSAWAGALDAGMSRDAVAGGFVNSAERHDLEVSGLYQDLLHRSSTAQERAGWVGAMSSGLSLHDVAKGFLLSPEYQQKHAGDDAFVRGLYSDLLHRQGSDSEVAGWRRALASGATQADVAQGFLGSQERGEKEVGELYTELLHRPGSQAEHAAWVPYLDSHGDRIEEVARVFVQSREFEAEAQAEFGS